MSVGKYLDGTELKITEKVDADSMLSTRLMSEDQGVTIVFDNFNGGKAVGNLFSTRKKVADALNIDQSEIVTSLIHAVDNPCDTELVDNPEFRYQTLPTDLMSLPICRYFPEDGGRYISSGIIISEYNGKKNVSFHRMMIMDRDRIAVRLVPRHLYRMYSEAKEKGEELKIAICIGARPEVLLAAATSTAYETDELTIASSLCKKTSGSPLKVGKTDNGLIIPSECDYVFEAKITFDETEEGPFVDITGTYDYVRMQPIIKVEKIWANKNPYFHFILPGGNEHYLFMGLPREPMMYISVRNKVPGIKDVRLTEGGCCWLNGVVSIKKVNEDDGRVAALAALDGHKSMKNVIVVDDDVDIFDDKQVEWAVATRFQATRLITVPNSKGSSLDPSADDSITCKVGIDATIPLDRDKAAYIKAKL
jgi:2,5-furandicarboxylate decarboxylase 1